MSEASANDGRDHIVRGLVRLMMAVDRAYTEVGRELGMTAQQAQLLCAAQRPAPIGEIATFLRCDRSNVSHLVERAASRGLLQRRAAESDGRLKLVELSPEGKEAVQQFIEGLGSRFNTLLAEWPEDRLQDAQATLHALAEALERDPDADVAAATAKPPAEPFP